MTWENVGSCGTGQLPGDKYWIDYCYRMAIDYLGFVLEDPPAGCELGIMWHEHDFGEYPSVGVNWDFPQSEPPWTYIRKCETALSKFDESIEWFDISPGEIEADLEADGLLESNDESEIQESCFDADSRSGAIDSSVTGVAFKSPETGAVLVGSNGRWFSNASGSWAPRPGRVTIGALDEDGWREITDEKEVSRLVAEATSSSTESPTA